MLFFNKEQVEKEFDEYFKYKSDLKDKELRDWFAGMALQGVLYMVTHGKHELHPHGEVGLSKECYKIADAMMEARKK